MRVTSLALVISLAAGFYFQPFPSLSGYLFEAGMSPHQTKAFGPMLRVFAAATLLVWISALALCAHLCSTACEAANPETSHCHATDDAGSQHHHDEAESHHHHDDFPAPSHHGPCRSTSCLTIQNAVLGSKAAIAPHPNFVPLYTLPAFVLELDDADTAFQPTFRQAKPRDWVFTPEVCLGPAFRSLAPPLA